VTLVTDRFLVLGRESPTRWPTSAVGKSRLDSKCAIGYQSGSDKCSFANALRKVEFKLLHIIDEDYLLR
jgi:hypothetical protein